MTDLKIPPQNIEAEIAVIGSILIDPEVLNRVADVLIPESFYDPRHQVLFDGILELYKKNKPVDVLTLTNELKKKGTLKNAGGSNYLPEILAATVVSSNIEEYANIVKEAAIRRKLISLSAKFTELARKEGESLEDILNEVEKSVFQVTDNSTKSDFQDSAKLVELQMQKADEYAKNPGALRGLATGLETLDKQLGGLHNSDLIIIAARPGVGKSAISFDILRNVATKEKKSVAIFSLEMPAVQVIERILAQQTKIDLWNLRMGTMAEEDYAKYSEGAGIIADSKIFVDDTAGINIVQLRSKVRRLKIEHGLDLVLIDYLQLMQGHTKDRDNRAQEIGEISRSLKLLARELNIPVIALSQLNRAVENRIDGVPQLSDLRESGSIEQDADLVMFLSRNMSENDEEMDYLKVDLHIAKHRNGPIGHVKLKFIPKQQRYEVNNDD